MPTSDHKHSLSIRGTHTRLEDLIALNQWVWHIRPDVRMHRAAGTQLSLLKGRGIDFEEVRAYQPGDDIASIDWRVTARTGKVHTKVFREEKQRSAMICLDQSSSMYFGSKDCFKSVYAAYLAAALAWTLHRHGDNVGGLIFGDQEQLQMQCRGGRQNILRLLAAIHQLNQSIHPDQHKPDTVNTMLQQLSQIAGHSLLLYIISDFADFDDRSLVYLRYLAKKNCITLFCIYDPLEAALPADTELCFSNGTERQSLYTDSAVQNTYAKLWQQRHQYIAQHTRSFGINTFYVQKSDQIRSCLNFC